MSSSSLTPRAASAARFVDDRLGRPAAVVAAQRRDDAERALVVAAFGDLHVGVVPRRREDSAACRRRRCRSAAPAACRVPRLRAAAPGRRSCAAVPRKNVSGDAPSGTPPPIARTISGTSPVPRTASISGISALQLVAIALGQAAGHDQPLAGAVLLVPRHLENRVDRFLLGRVDERAGVDDEHVGLRRVLRQLVPRLLREAEHHLGVDEVLRTTERNETNLHNDQPRDTSTSSLPRLLLVTS